jgi:methylated-DNA-protein-cysteine methyltransferase-like protein
MKPRRTDDRDQALQRIRATVDAIPRGRVATYGRVAELAGLPRRARLVGRVLARLEHGSTLPWHRVVGAGGLLSSRPGGVAEQRRRLACEGVLFARSGRIDLARFGWGAEG